MGPEENRSSHPPPQPRVLGRVGGFSLGKFLGVPVFIDRSWLIIFFLITWTISEEFAEAFPAPALHLTAGLITSLLFFACVFLHEMGHSLVARAFGIPVLSITLFIFGGVAHIRSEPRKPLHEFLIAIAGPLTSLVLSTFFFCFCLLFSLIPSEPTGLAAMAKEICLWLGGINLMLAIFNMIPGFPLDGGRVLRSAVWAISGQFETATRVAAAIGTLFAYFFIAMGLYLLVAHGLWLNGIWLVLIGAFLFMAARGSVVQLATRRTFSRLRVSDVLEQIPYRVSPGVSVQSIVDGPVLHQGHRTFAVEDKGVLRGLVTLREIKAMPRDEWPTTPLQSIMIPARDLVVVEPHVTLETVMQTMEERGIQQMPVVESDRIVGIVSRDGMMRVVQNRWELGAR